MSTFFDPKAVATTELLHRNKLGYFWPRRLLWGIPVLGIVALVVIPLMSFLLLAFFPNLYGNKATTFSLTAFKQAVTGYDLRALFDSFWVGLSAGVVGTLIGAWLAWLTTSTTFYGRKLVGGAIWLILILPSYFIAVGWDVLLSPGGLISWPLLSSAILGPVGVMLILACKGVPFSYLLMITTWRGLPAEFDEAARVHGVRYLSRIKLSLQILLPGLIAGFAIVYAESISDFGVAATLAAGVHFPLGTYAIYSAIDSQPLNFPLAAASSWLLLLLVIPAIWLQARINRQARRYSVLTGRSRLPKRRTLPFQAVLGHGLGATVFILFSLGVPLISAIGLSLEKNLGIGIVWSNLTFYHYWKVFTDSNVYQAFGYSLEMGLISALITVGLGLFVVFLLLRRGQLARVLDGTLLTIMALPGLILAAGYIFTFNQPWLPLYGSSLLLGMAYVTVALPIASRMLLGPVSQQHRNLHEAARVHGISALVSMLRIRFPLLATPLFFACLVTASHLIFELPASELLYPPGSPTLAVSLVDYLRGFHYATESALQITSMLLVGIVVGLSHWLFRSFIPSAWRRETTGMGYE